MIKKKKQQVVILSRKDLEKPFINCNLENIRRERFVFEARKAICDSHFAIFKDGEESKLLK